MKVALIIAAAGVGSRFSKDVKKQFYEIDNKPLLYYTIKKITSLYSFNEIILGIDKNDENIISEICKDVDENLSFKLVEGGLSRANTVYNCINESNSDIVLIHDAVRPFITKKIVDDVVNATIKFGGAIPAVKVRDTVKKVINNSICKTLNRDYIYLAHTPQGFNCHLIKESLKKALNDNIQITDEASAMEYCTKEVKVVDSNYDNIKITFSDDIQIVKVLKNKYFI